MTDDNDIPPTYEDTLAGTTPSLQISASPPQSNANPSSPPRSVADPPSTVPHSVGPSSTATVPDQPHRSSPPPDAQRVVAPFTHNQTNSGLSGDYIVFLGESKVQPDINITTTNGGINTTLFLKSTPPGGRPAAIVSQSTNGRNHIEIASRDSALDIKLKGTNGGIKLAIPRDFDGIVTLRSVNGSKKLSPAMAPGAVIVPADGGSNSVAYRIRPRGNHASAASTSSAPPPPPSKGLLIESEMGLHGFPVDKKAPVTATASPPLTATSATTDDRKEAWMADASSGPDSATMHTTNGSILVRYADEEIEEAGRSCVVM